jgi:type III restriction enzyme
LGWEFTLLSCGFKLALTRRTIAAILRGILAARFAQFKTNPEQFIMEASRLINEQKATVIVEHLTYDTTTGTYDAPEIFTQRKEDLSNGFKANKHIYDYVFTDSGGERTFVGQLDTSTEVIVYAKLPKAFAIPTPVGNYSPDWAIAFQTNQVKHIYFIAETKGSMSTLQLKDIEKSKIACAKKFFAKITDDQVRYEMIDSYGKLMELVK